MPIKTLTLGLALLATAGAMAQTQHTIRPRDTISKLAEVYRVPTRVILRANGLKENSRLKLGQKVLIPPYSAPSKKVATATSGGRTYKVRNGDSDWTIARKFDLTSRQLLAANPGVNFHPLKLGITLSIPSSSNSTPAKVAQKQPLSIQPKAKYSAYKVQKGDNDWVIAGNLGVPRKLLVALNPKTNWRKLRPGMFLVVPSSGSAPSVVASGGTSKVASKRIRTRYAKVIGNGATIRRQPSTTAGVVTRVDSGLRVAVLDREGDWYKLRFPRGTVGWMRGDLLAPSSAAPEFVNARRSTRTRYAKRRQRGRGISQGEKQSILAQVPSDNALLAKARSYVGVRYRLGMASRSGTDCSGFTTQVFRSQGVRLPRTSREQASVGQRVGKGGLSKGDLVFFRTGRGKRVSHVGIYVGGGKFIHASSGGGKVQVNSLSDGYYANRFVTARRVAAKPGSKASSKSKSKSTATKR